MRLGVIDLNIKASAHLFLQSVLAEAKNQDICLDPQWDIDHLCYQDYSREKQKGLVSPSTISNPDYFRNVFPFGRWNFSSWHRHFLVEEKILKLGGASVLSAVKSLRSNGLKTEPAFAQVLNLHGDAYNEMLHLQKDPLPILNKKIDMAKGQNV